MKSATHLDFGTSNQDQIETITFGYFITVYKQIKHTILIDEVHLKLTIMVQHMTMAL